MRMIFLRLCLFLSALLGGCGMVWRIGYEAPAGFYLEVRADYQAATQPGK